MGKDVRLFLALDPGDEIQAGIRSALSGMRRICPVPRWNSMQNIHMTLKFLGATPESRIPDIDQALTQLSAKSSAFSYALKGIGAFPSFKRPAILWAGVGEGREALSQFGNSLIDALSAFGFGKEERDFVPHITLARVKRSGRIPRKQLTDLLNKYQFHVFGAGTVDHVSLYSSILKPSGAVHRELQKWKLSPE